MPLNSVLQLLASALTLLASKADTVLTSLGVINTTLSSVQDELETASAFAADLDLSKASAATMNISFNTDVEIEIIGVTLGSAQTLQLELDDGTTQLALGNLLSSSATHSVSSQRAGLTGANESLTNAMLIPYGDSLKMTAGAAATWAVKLVVRGRGAVPVATVA